LIAHRAHELDELAPYLQAVRRHRVPTREEEHRLALRARRGELAARDELVRRNLALVIAVIRRQRRFGVPLDDLVQEGNLGLMRAAEKFDPHAGTRFSTYATWWIRAYVGRYLKGARSTVRPRSGTVAPVDLSLDAPVGEDGDATFLDRLEDGAPGPEDRCAASLSERRLRESLAKVRGRLGELGWDIVHSRLGRDAPETLDQIGRRWGVSRERVRQVELSTRAFLARHLQREGDGGVPGAA
jgi:RNA polymerase primary sigma factor